MKESLKDIFERVWENYCDFLTKGETSKEHYLTAKRERNEAASGYVSSLLELGVNWVEAVNNDVYGLAVPIHYPPSQLSKEKQETYRHCVDHFLKDVGRAMPTHGFKPKQIKELKPLTRYLLGYHEIPNMRVEENLTEDEATSEYDRMKQQGLIDVCFFPTEIFPAKYMAFGYKPSPKQASIQNQLLTDNNQEDSKEKPKTIMDYYEAKEIPTIAKKDKEYLMFGGALLKQYMHLENGCYRWTLPKALLAFMCGYIYCDDRINEKDDNKVLKKGNTRLPAKDINKLFPDMKVAINRNMLKNPPRDSWKIEDLIEDTKKVLYKIKQKA